MLTQVQARERERTQRGRALFEHTGDSPRVDRAAGIIRGVKVLGLKSKNGREYTADAVRRAVPLYEGCRVFADHNTRGSRSVRDLVGTLKNVRFVEGSNAGLVADFHVLPSHPVSATAMDCAERAPGLLGFSHDADGDEKMRNGRRVVENIERVNSVDLVVSPATNSSLFESHIGDERHLPSGESFLKAVCTSATRRQLQEQDGMSEPARDDPAEAERRERANAERDLHAMLSSEDGEYSDDQVKEAFLRAAIAILKDEGDTVAGKLSRLKKLLDAQEDSLDTLLRAIDPDYYKRQAAQRKEANEQQRETDRRERKDAARRAALESLNEACGFIERGYPSVALSCLELDLKRLQESAPTMAANFARAIQHAGPTISPRLP